MSRIRTYLVGRDERCDYPIADGSVSRRHAEVVLAPDGRFYVTDCGSTGGTFVLNGREWTRVRQAYVEPTDRVRFGGYEMAAARLAVLRGGSGGGGGASDRAGPKPAGLAPDAPKKRVPGTGEVVDKEP